MAAGVLVVAVIALADVRAQEAIFVVRHAEKVDDSDDAALSSLGHARARRLADFLADAGVDAIFGTERQRTIQTARPLAERRGLEIEAIPRAETARLIATLRERHAGHVVVVVGHSDTVPVILRELGHPEPITIADDEYDNVFLVIPREAGPSLVRLRVK